MMNITVKFGKQMYRNTSKYCLFNISEVRLRTLFQEMLRNETTYKWI